MYPTVHGVFDCQYGTYPRSPRGPVRGNNDTVTSFMGCAQDIRLSLVPTTSSTPAFVHAKSPFRDDMRLSLSHLQPNNFTPFGGEYQQ